MTMSEPKQLPKDKEQLISLPKAAEIYGFSPDYLGNLARSGRLDATKIGNSWVTTPRAVESYIASRKKVGRYREDIAA